MQPQRVPRRNREALDVFIHQRLVERLQFARQRLIAAEVDGLSRAVDHRPRQTLRVLNVHDLQPVPDGQLGSRGHLREKAEDPLQEVWRLGMRKTPHDGW